MMESTKTIAIYRRTTLKCGITFRVCVFGFVALSVFLCGCGDDFGRAAYRPSSSYGTAASILKQRAAENELAESQQWAEIRAASARTAAAEAAAARKAQKELEAANAAAAREAAKAWAARSTLTPPKAMEPKANPFPTLVEP